MPHLEVCNCASCCFIRQNEYEQREFIQVQKEKLKTFLLTYSYSYWLGIFIVSLPIISYSSQTQIVLSLFPPYTAYILILIILLNYAFAISYLSYLLKPKDVLKHIFTISLVYSLLINLSESGTDIYNTLSSLIIFFCLHLGCFCVGYILRAEKNKQLPSRI